MKNKVAVMPQDSVIDLEELILHHARDWYKDFEQQGLEKKFGKLPWDKLQVDIDRSKLIIEHDEALHEKEAAVGSYSPRHKVLFKSKYNNTTGTPLSYQVSTERRTRTSLSMTITKGFRFGVNFDVKLGPPNVEATLGMSNEVSFDKSVQTTKEQEVSWTVNTSITVPPHKSTTVKLIVKDDEYKGTFTVRTYFSGKVFVHLQKDNTHLTKIVIGNLRSILKPELGFKEDNKTKRFYFDSVGICNCRYGVEQEVDICETSLVDQEESEGIDSAVI